VDRRSAFVNAALQKDLALNLGGGCVAKNTGSIGADRASLPMLHLSGIVHWQYIGPIFEEREDAYGNHSKFSIR
jgi:hypothetical protein